MSNLEALHVRAKALNLHGPFSRGHQSRQPFVMAAGQLVVDGVRAKIIHRNSKGLINYYNSSQIPFPANSNQYRFNNEFLINQKL